LFELAIVIAHRSRGSKPLGPLPLRFNGYQHSLYANNSAIRVSKIRDSEKFSARRKNSGAIS